MRIAAEVSRPVAVVVVIVIAPLLGGDRADASERHSEECHAGGIAPLIVAAATGCVESVASLVAAVADTRSRTGVKPLATAIGVSARVSMVATAMMVPRHAGDGNFLRVNMEASLRAELPPNACGTRWTKMIAVNASQGAVGIVQRCRVLLLAGKEPQQHLTFRRVGGIRKRLL